MSNCCCSQSKSPQPSQPSQLSQPSPPPPSQDETPASSCCHHADRGTGSASDWLKLGFAALVAGWTMMFGIGANLTPPEGEERYFLHGILLVSTVIVMALTGGPILIAAWKGLRQLRPNVEQLFLSGIAGAFFASLHSTLTGYGDIYYEVVAVLLAIYTLGNIVGKRKRNQALDAANALRREFDHCIKLTCCGKQQPTTVAEIEAGDRILVPQGEGIPIDGTVLEGTAFVRETPLTGEPFPVVKRPGDSVLAGSTVEDHDLVLESRTSGHHRRLDQLLSAVEQARTHPASLQREADRIVAWFLPAVMTLAVLTFGYWTGAAGWIVGTFNALAVLVVACPCAMGLATPIGIWNAMTLLTRHGILPASGDWVERMAKVDTVVFDKTGTLSEEQLALLDFAHHPSLSRTHLQALIAATQARSNHPIARAFSVWAPLAEQEKIAPDTDPTILPGIGIEARIPLPDGSRSHVAIGNESLKKSPDDDSREKELLAALTPDSGHTHPVYIRLDGQLAGIALLREKFRDATPDMIRELGAMGLRTEVMTGDRAESLTALSGLPGLHTHASLLPDDKARLVEKLQGKEQRRVLFVGDGINDSPAMARAHASLAISEGATLTRETAQATLFNGSLTSIPFAITLARRTVAVIRQNLIFAACYNTIGVSLAATGILHPVVAAILMLGSSLFVSWNALRVAR